MRCTCSIVPKDILARLSQDPSLDPATRKALSSTALLDTEVRKSRNSARAFTRVAQDVTPSFQQITDAPEIHLFNCRNRTSLPGSFMADPSGDESAHRTHTETTAVVRFFQEAFGRNSIDGAGMTVISSVHYDHNYANAMWNGFQMIYGDGDGEIFVDFTKGPDVIAHELTHGVTQFTVQLDYDNDPGGLNESLSDCFGSMFRQWRAGQTAREADWLIGKEIMGPAAHGKGIFCLRDMAKPSADHCLAPQPIHYAQVTPGMDPHYSSGPPNHAFYAACMDLPDKPSWEVIGQVWYRAITGGAAARMTMPEFAARTRQAAQQLNLDAAARAAVDGGWKRVGL